MQIRSIKLGPALITAFVLGIICIIDLLPKFLPSTKEDGRTQFNLFERLESLTFDLRVRWATHFQKSYASNLLGAVYISDKDLTEMNDGSYGYRVKFPWPRYFYGRVVNELSAQGASAVALDIFFDQTEPDAEIKIPSGKTVRSDSYFADQLNRAGNVALAADAKGNIFPAPLFETNAFAVGNVYTKVDSDGILRRAKVFVPYRRWHRAILQMARALNWDVPHAQFQSNRITFPRLDGQPSDFVPLAQDGALRFDQDHELVVNQNDFPSNEVPKGSNSSTSARPYEDIRVWQLGIILAARYLKLDLEHPVIHKDQVILNGPGGLQRIIPVDEDGFFYVDWAVKLIDPDPRRLIHERIAPLIRQSEARDEGQSNFDPTFRGKLVFVGSIATGGNVSDRGATPLENESVLVSQHWNVANSVIKGHFITRASTVVDLFLIVLFGILAAFLTWNLRVFLAPISILSISVAYAGLAFLIYVQYRYWLPFVSPVVGGLLLPHFSLITYRVVFEERERRRVKAVFTKMVSPDVVNELLSAETLALGGARRHLTVLFADVRGFTEFTDVNQANAEELVRQRGLTGKEAEDCHDQQAREALSTVSLYLGVIADTVKKHHGTLDKYIGDCVMAFWGAPSPDEHHALGCVRAVIEAQRAIYSINQKRFAENKRRERENSRRRATGGLPLPMLSLLTVGCGINSGKMTVGLMGSDAHILNFTVFGRDVNVASRLEGVAGRGVIIISEATFTEIQRDDPALAATCLERPAVQVKGIRQPVKIYEVPWNQSGGKSSEIFGSAAKVGAQRTAAPSDAEAKT